VARLFIAIELPDEIKRSLSSMCQEIPDARWVGGPEIHLTLRFIGDVLPQTFAQIKKELATVSFAPFPLTLKGVGHFPPHGHPRVLWIGLEPCSALVTLQQQIEAALAKVGIAAEERPFSPHITLARLKEHAAAAVAQFEARHHDLSFPPFTASEFILFSSVLTPRGAIHRKEEIYRPNGKPA